MSLKSWKQEYYPVGASTVARDKTKTDVDLLDHCIRKWIGAGDHATEKHTVSFANNMIQDKSSSVVHQYFSLAGSSCALCQRHDRSVYDGTCKKCPLAQYRNGVRCYNDHPTLGNPYKFADEKSPAMMVEQLYETKKWVQAGKPERPPIDKEA